MASLRNQYFGAQHAYSSYTRSAHPGMPLLGVGPGGEHDLDIETRLTPRTAQCCDYRRSSWKFLEPDAAELDTQALCPGPFGIVARHEKDHSNSQLECI